ncbi:MAG: tellurite resistance TerB family protein [Candidatus Competibacteraceae bacterium]|nr:tellurite resistance TerB family protein [Candidatus Competibacteraceae bacterium]
MDVQALFDQLLKSGRDLVGQGQNLAEQKLEIPPAGAPRESALSGMGKGAALGGLAMLLLGTGVGRSLSGLALKLGSLGAIGGLAYKTYQDWQANTQAGGLAFDPAQSVDALSGPKLEKRSLTLLKAMIAAAKADGHIDVKEQAAIDSYLQKLELDAPTLAMLKAEIGKPLSAKDVAAGSDSPAAAAEIYLTSLVAVDLNNQQERTYMEELARELKLPPDLVSELQNKARA